MEQKIKIIIIGLAGLCIVCLLLFLHSVSQQQRLIRESNDLKTENAALVSKAKQLENDLKGNQGKMDSLKAERDKISAELNDLQGRLDSATKARDALIQKLKEKNQQQAVVAAAPVQPEPQPAPALQNNDAYWGTVLKAKKELEMQLADIRVELRNLQMINESLQKEKNRTDIEVQLSGVRSELRSLQISNESLQRQKGLLEADISNLRNEKKDILRQLDYNQKLVDSMSEEVARERNDKISIQESFKTAKAENGVLLRQLKSLVSRKTLLDKKVQDLQESKSVLEKRLNETEMMLVDNTAKAEALKGELDELKSSGTEKKSKGSVELPAIVVRSAPASGKSRAGADKNSGTILAVNLENNFVVVSIGASAGVDVGNTFTVFRDGKSIGTISVIQTRTNISACDIKRMSTPLRIGDQVE